MSENRALGDLEHEGEVVEVATPASSTLLPATMLANSGVAMEDNQLELGAYAQQAYLEYALSVVKGRALPDVVDGQKPVQRRLLYAMQRMGLGYSGSQSVHGAKPVKSARVVGDVLGRYHPHGDQAAYDALVRMAQDFTQRYPLIDGQGNFGSRDGDNAAAMRYTEARLARISSLLLDELDDGTVEWMPNYDGSTEEPRLLPSRLPFVLLNGASGIAVGMACEIPSHNLSEVVQALVALVRDPNLSDEVLFGLLPAPDFACGGQIISSTQEIVSIYLSGRGSIKAKARAQVEPLARGQWQWVVNELPPGTSAQRVLQELEDITNPKPKLGKKALSADQIQLKQSMLALLEGVRDESSKTAPVRLVFEPKSSKVEVELLQQMLLSHTSLETSVAINLTMIGVDGKPTQKNLRTILTEWIAQRMQTVRKRTAFRLGKVQDRIHILQGRQLVLLNVDEVIQIVRQAEEPKAALIERFALTEIQAEDILEIRLRQLARLEAIKIEQELANLQVQEQSYQQILGSENALRKLLIKEMESDAKTFGDSRRTLVLEEKRASIQAPVIDGPLTVIVSQKGWVRTQKGHEVDVQSLSFKTGDGLYATFACRSVDHLLAFGSNGRVYSVAVNTLPGGRGDGAPLSTMIDIQSGSQVLSYFAGAADVVLMLMASNGYGFVAKVEDMLSRTKAGKAFVTLGPDENLCQPVAVQPEDLVVAVDQDGAVGVMVLEELRHASAGGKGLQGFKLAPNQQLSKAIAVAKGQTVLLLYQAGRTKIAQQKMDYTSIQKLLQKRPAKPKHLKHMEKVVGLEMLL